MILFCARHKSISTQEVQGFGKVALRIPFKLLATDSKGFKKACHGKGRTSLQHVNNIKIYKDLDLSNLASHF